MKLHSSAAVAPRSGDIEQHVLIINGLMSMLNRISASITETGKIVPATFGGWRKSKKYDPYKDIRKNLFEHYEQDAMEQESRPS